MLDRHLRRFDRGFRRRASASARCTLSSITVRSIRSAKESASSRYAADAPGPNVMNACRARSFNRAADRLRVRSRPREVVLRLDQPSLQVVEPPACGVTSDARDRIRRWSSATMRGRPRPVPPAGPRVRAPSRPASGLPRRSRLRPTRPTRTTPPRRGGAKRSVWSPLLPPRSSIGRPGETLDVAEGTLGYEPMMAPDPLDFLDVDRLLVRRGATGARPGAGVGRRPGPARTSTSGSSGRVPEGGRARSSATLGLLGMHLEGYGCAGRERRQLRPRVPGARGGRLAASGRS